MADNLTDTAENLLLNWLVTNGTATRPTLPMKVALCTAAPTDAAAGTEVAGGSYARQPTTFAASSGGATSNTAEIRFTGMPATTVTHLEVWDSAGTPVRLWYGPLSASKTTNAGDDFVIAAGDLDLAIS